MSWDTGLKRAPQELISSYGITDWETFVNHSNIIAPQVLTALQDHGLCLANRTKVLDFGCGIGRTLAKLFIEHKIPTHASDVNPLAYEYLKSILPSLNLLQTNFYPPTPYDSDYFDAIYSISVWTHLKPEEQLEWLSEMKRILAPNGVILISFIGPDGLQIRKERFESWKHVSDIDIMREGIKFIPYQDYSEALEKIGIKSTYGTAIHTHDFIYNEWAKILRVETIVEKGIAGCQSYVILRKSDCP